MTEPIKLSTFVVPELGRQRIDAQWARIAERRPLEPKRHGRMVPMAGGLALLAAVAVLWWPRESRTTVASVWEGSVVSSDDAPVDMTLPEGTHIKVEPRSEVKLLHSAARAVKVRLGHGSARFEVAKNPSRRFSVDMGEVEVVVTGTEFRVHRRPVVGGERLHVEVLEGSVEVHREGGGVVALRRGERWSTVVSNAQASAEARAQAMADDARAEQREPALADEEREKADADAELAEPAEGVEADELAIDDLDADPSAERARRRKLSRAAAGELFDHANLARRAGRLDDAADLYAKLVSAHPRDRRAPLAAFELGRLRMDSLRDMRGAVHALERALQLAPQGTFAEDAMARVVLAQEALHDKPGCLRARGRYLGRYPQGVHAQHVAERCGAN
jgi:TolA-binding protein